jgi:hypothetical protein
MSRPGSTDTRRTIPDYPGPLPRAKPQPPKYIVRVDEKTGQEVQITGTPPPIRPIGVTEIPSPAKLASVTHVPDYEYGHVKRATKKVDSKSDVKASHKQTSYSVGGPPEHIGSTFRHLPNSANMRTGSVPSDPSIPVPYVAAPKEAFHGDRLLSNRMPNGEILGAPARRYADVAHVPQLPLTSLVAEIDEPVGPDNPVKQINNTWSECWDDEAGAIYYYNKMSGEATWIAPEELSAYLEKRKFATISMKKGDAYS